MTNEPSPRPWRVEKAADECRFWIVRNPDGVSIGMTWLEADAALIVVAVNERDELLREMNGVREAARKVVADWQTALDERDRLRDIVRRLADLSESLLANYEYRYREDVNSMAFVENTRGFLREARAAIGEDAP